MMTHLLGSGLDKASLTELEKAAKDIRRQIEAGNEAARGFLEQIEDRIAWKRNRKSEEQ